MFFLMPVNSVGAGQVFSFCLIKLFGWSFAVIT